MIANRVSLLTDFELCDDHLDWSLGTHGVYVQFPATPSTPPTPYPRLKDPANRHSYASLSSLPAFEQGGVTNGRSRILSATFLPDVPPEQSWSQIETIDSAIQKSGYRGVIDDDLRASCRVVRYQSRKISVTYSEWLTSRSTLSS